MYYAATDLEARICTGRDVVVVGGGNSAGQAAIYMAQQNCKVRIAIRRDDLSQTMSRYLIERIEANPRIEVLANTEVRALAGEGHLEQATIEHTPTGEHRTIACGGLFCFIGAEPATSWLKDSVALDSHGFILTDRDVMDRGPAERPFADETRCRSRRRSWGSSLWETSDMARSSGWRPPWARDRARSDRCTSI